MEPVLFWKRFSFLLLGVLIAAILWPATNSAYHGLGLPLPAEIPSTNLTLPLDPHGDAIDILTAQQCSSAFPGLYQEIDRAVEHFSNSRNSISKEDVNITWRDGAAMRILIHDNQLRVLETRGVVGALGYDGRGLPLLNMLQRAMDSATAGGERLPSIEASIVLEDISDPPAESSISFWSFARNLTKESHKRLWLVPNFDFYVQNEGAFEDVRRRGIDRDVPFAEKIPQAVWRGQTWLNNEIRGGLVAAGKNESWADFQDTQADHKVWLRPDELCKYAITVHTEGVSFSGRLASLLLCNSLTFVHDLSWNAHFYGLLRPDGPGQNYVPVRRDWTDLEEKVQHFLGHPSEAEKIIENSINVFRSRALSRAGTSCYLRKLVQGYRTVAFEPEVYRPAKQGQLLRRRGLSFESFVAFKNDLHDENKDVEELLEDLRAKDGRGT